MKWHLSSLSLALVVACNGSASTPPSTTGPTTAPTTPAPSTTDKATADGSLPTWMQGTWRTAKGHVSEQWVDVGGVLVGIGLGQQKGATQFFEVMLVHKDSAGLAYVAMPNGRKQVRFAATLDGPSQLTASNPRNDSPKKLRYQRTKTGLEVEIHGPSRTSKVAYAAATAKPAPALEAADRAFDKDSAARGGAAWADRFEDGAAMWPIGMPRIAGHVDIAKTIDGGRADGAVLRWTPSASGMSSAGDVGFTAGAYRLVGAKGATLRAGTYVTIWRKDKAGAWKIAFDTGVQTSGSKPAAKPKPATPPAP